MVHSKKFLKVAAVLVGSQLLLVGCIKLNVEATIADDGTVSGEIISALEIEAFQSISEQFDSGDEFDPEEAKQQAVDELETQVADLDLDPDSITVEEYDEDGFVGTRVTFENLDPEAFAALMSSADSTDSGATEEFTIDVEAESIRIEFPVTFDDSGGGDDEIPIDIFANADVSLSFTMPGEITDSEGFEVDGCTASWQWDPDDTSTETLVVESGTEGCSSSGSSDSSTIILIISGAAVGLGVLLALILLLTGRKGGGTTPEPNSTQFGSYAPPTGAPVMPPVTPPTAPPADGPWTTPPSQ